MGRRKMETTLAHIVAYFKNTHDTSVGTERRFLVWSTGRRSL